MTEILYAVGILVALLFIWDRLNRSKVERLRRQGLYPAPGQETEGEVIALWPQPSR